MKNSLFFLPIEKTLSVAATPDKSGPGSNGNEGILHIPKSFRAGASPSNGLLSYPGHDNGLLI